MCFLFFYFPFHSPLFSPLFLSLYGMDALRMKYALKEVVRFLFFLTCALLNVCFFWPVACEKKERCADVGFCLDARSWSVLVLLKCWRQNLITWTAMLCDMHFPSLLRHPVFAETAYFESPGTCTSIPRMARWTYFTCALAYLYVPVSAAFMLSLLLVALHRAAGFGIWCYTEAASALQR